MNASFSGLEAHLVLEPVSMLHHVYAREIVNCFRIKHFFVALTTWAVLTPELLYVHGSIMTANPPPP